MRRAEVADPVAVVGLAIRTPRAADRTEFWANVAAGTDCISTVDDDGPDTVPAKGILTAADEFDAEFFGLSPRAAVRIDPQERVFLELVWHALEDSGYRPDGCGRVGVFASCAPSTYPHLLDPVVNPPAPLAEQVTRRLGLTGPAVTVPAASSSSLVAVDHAVRALRAGACDTAIAGGITVTLPLHGGYRRRPPFSPDGRCRVFDASADGTVPGDGGAAIVLRRAAEAFAAGDDPYALILGSAVASGAQAAITIALRAAGVATGEVGLIEAHATGRPAADVREIAALRAVFGSGRGARRRGLAAGKSGIGHLGAAAGIVGVVSAVLAVQAGLVPPVVGLRRVDPRLGLESSPFHPSSRSSQWPVPGQRVAGVTALAPNGADSHLVLAQAPALRPALVGADGPAELVLRSRTPRALDALAEALAGHLDRHPDQALVDVAYTLAVGRTVGPYQRRVAGSDRGEVVARLRADTTVETVDPGLAVDLDGVGRRLHLPGYPFQRRRFWPSDAFDAGWLCDIFSEVAGARATTDRDNFFSLGGDARMAVTLISRISALAGVELDLDRFLADPTPATLVRLVAAGDDNTSGVGGDGP
jgi:acyl transferase domain-containing protein